MKLDFNKMGGLIPAIIQDSCTGKVLMLGFMNEEALAKTQEMEKLLSLVVQKIDCGQKERQVVTS